MQDWQQASMDQWQYMPLAYIIGTLLKCTILIIDDNYIIAKNVCLDFFFSSSDVGTAAWVAEHLTMSSISVCLKDRLDIHLLI